MKFFTRLLLGVFTLILMGLAQSPLPCQGDGRGHACSAASCVCLASCSCKSSCEQEAVPPAGTPHAHCHHVTVKAHACHAMGTSDAAPRHFTLPKPLPVVLLTPSFTWSACAVGRSFPHGLARHYVSPSLKSFEPPPRVMA